MSRRAPHIRRPDEHHTETVVLYQLQMNWAKDYENEERIRTPDIQNYSNDPPSQKDCSLYPNGTFTGIITNIKFTI